MPAPEPAKLSAALHQYAKEKLTVKQRLARLEAEFNYVIKYVQISYVNLSTSING
jgi:hypothetical protein